jgi:hypothetical protein
VEALAVRVPPAPRIATSSTAVVLERGVIGRTYRRDLELTMKLLQT